MTQEQLRLDVQASVAEWVEWFMSTNNIPASIMEDSLNKVLLTVKDKTFREFMVAVNAANQQQQEVESEVDGGE